MLPVLQTELGLLYHADCLDWLPSLHDSTVDLVFADPPFNLNKDYGSGISDKLDEEEYLTWCETWIKECVRVLKPGGALFLYNIPRWNIHFAPFLLGAGMEFRNWVAIDLKVGLPIAGRLYPAHHSLLYFTKGKPRVFSRPRVPIQVCRHCGRDVKDYGGHRGKIHPDGVNVSDVWSDIPPVRHRGTKSRVANQLSEKLLSRVLQIGTAPGDLVLDPFGGSGTTFSVAEKMHRRWLGCELGDIDPIRKRLRGEESLYMPPGKGDSRKGLRRNVNGMQRNAE